MIRNCHSWFASVATLATSAAANAQAPQDVDWPGVGNDPGCMRYSTLDQINRENVHQLKPAWTYHTGELRDGDGKTIECTPIVVDGVMYVTTGRLAGRRARRGDRARSFGSSTRSRIIPFPHAPTSGGVNRGCAYWSDGQPDGERRIIHGTSDGRLFSLDAKTGKLDAEFGERRHPQSPRRARSRTSPR